ncbi:MAG TPA: AAA family ATPase [Gammaproteobacteria bacterium]|nr:AAA family ATPase [Gammaproteobacteria bacterium]
MLDELRKLSHHFLDIKNQAYQRYLIKNTPFTQRLSILIGQRGVGKTTTLVQHLLSKVANDRLNSQILYIQADHFLVGNTSLYEIAEEFSLLGGRWIAFDEIHKYSNWSQELKSIYDTFPYLQIITSGSSALEIHKGTHDLSRRAIVYLLHGLSFREYLELYYDLTLPNYPLDEILKNHEKLVHVILKIVAKNNKKILPHFLDYLNYGYYPYFREINDVPIYYLSIEQNIHTTIESDLVAIYPALTGNSIKKIKQLLSFISQAVPFTPNWQKLKSILDIGDERTLKTYFKYLEDAELIQTVRKATMKMKKLEMPEKIYLNNTNQMMSLSLNQSNKGTLRETFFLNMIATQHDVTIPSNGDFLVDHQFTFEIGGRKKNFEQIKDVKNAYLACDEMEIGIARKIPLWLFGFLY